jgi:hypothetical protein
MHYLPWPAPPAQPTLVVQKFFERADTDVVTLTKI